MSRKVQVEIIENKTNRIMTTTQTMLMQLLMSYSSKIMREMLNLLLQIPNISMTKILLVRLDQANCLAVLTQVVVRNIVNVTC